ncbi:MAG: BlaI/MecI/CopY family transcriptional regulator [Candidatus Omnitrophica bacterium]|nr:BlaI/MecI/CopY family transcriptional regulator [Candidatus Omnitrophota bacterium]
MKNLPKITPAEWEVMRVLWDRGGLNMMEIETQLEKDKGWRAYTSRTLLRRLFRKGAVSCDSTRRPAIYRAGLPKEACVREESQSLLKRVFRGAHAPFLINLIKEAPLTPKEIDEIKKILREKEK